MSTSTNRRRQHQEYEIATELAAGVEQLAVQKGQSISEILADVIRAGCLELANPEKGLGDFLRDIHIGESLSGEAAHFLPEVDPPRARRSNPALEPADHPFCGGGSTGGANPVSL